MTLRIPNGTITVSESKAKCVKCETAITIGEVDERLQKSKRGYIRYTCKTCQEITGVTSDYKGNIISFDFPIKTKCRDCKTQNLHLDRERNILSCAFCGACQSTDIK